jgi:hypothetical protein
MQFKPALLAVAISAVVLTGCQDNDDLNLDLSLDANEVGQVTLSESLGSVAFTVDGQARSLPLSVGFGSGAFHASGDDEKYFYTITDRGPNIACDETEAVLGVAEQCGVGNDDGKIFPVPSFAPKIIKWELSGEVGHFRAKKVEEIPLKKTDGTDITGLTNNLTSTNTEGAFDIDGNALDYDNSGMDPEALVRLADGSFWISEEYGPSIAHISSTGEVLERVVPASVAGDLADAGYPVTGALPDILKMRKLNRGIESIALAPDESALYFIMQSPLASPNNNTYKTSRTVRLLKFNLNTDGSLGAQAGEYVYTLDYPESFADENGNGDDSHKQNNVKISEMMAVGEDDLIILERIAATTKLYRVSLDSGDNIMDTTISSGTVTAPESADPKTLEQVFDPSALGATPVLKSLVFNSLTDMLSGTALPTKVEGIALLNSETLLLINDNDFGITGESTEVTLMPLGTQLTEGENASRISMEVIGRYNSGVYDESAAEIVDYHAATQRAFIVNANNQKVDVLDLSGLTDQVAANPITLNNVPLLETLSVQDDVTGVALGAANSLSIHGDLMAVAIENDNKQGNGVIAFYDISGSSIEFIQSVTVGALPDMVTFSPDGQWVLVANEGEPNDDYTVDPEGSVSLIAVNNGVPATTATTLDFTAFNAGGARAAELDDAVRVFGPGASVAMDLEPEYITVSADSQSAFVALQEANALAEIDLTTQSITAIHALGTKDYGLASNQIDASDKDDAVNFASYEGVVGMYQPDGITSMSFSSQLGDAVMVMTANEGDSRDYDGYSEEERADDLVSDNLLDANNAQYANAQDDAILGRLKVTTATGDTDGDGDIDVIHNYGARSFSIWNQGKQVFDSHADFGKITAGRLGLDFNGVDGRSDDKGGEPEAITLGTIDERTYAFVGLERTSGIFIYDVTNPYGVQFVDYIENIDRTQPEGSEGDVAPEGMKFISADNSPTGKPLLVVANEVSGTTTVYQIQ